MLKKFIPHDIQTDFDYEKFGKELEGYSGSDIRLVCKESRMQGVRKAILKIESLTLQHQNTHSTHSSHSTHISHKKDKDKDKDKENPANVKLEKITNDDFQTAFERTKPASLYKPDKYESWAENFGSY